MSGLIVWPMRLRQSPLPDRLDLVVADDPECGRGKRDEMGVGEALVVVFVGGDGPEQEAADGGGGVCVRLLGGDDGVFVADQRISIGAGSVDQRQPLVGRRARRPVRWPRW